jgi:hypothetical protein
MCSVARRARRPAPVRIAIRLDVGIGIGVGVGTSREKLSARNPTFGLDTDRRLKNVKQLTSNVNIILVNCGKIK